MMFLDNFFPRLQRLRLERGYAAENVGKLANAPALRQVGEGFIYTSSGFWV